jgi:uncharacterized lipoprotein YmbA
MKKLLSFVGTLLLTACGGTQNPDAFLKTGTSAPQFSVNDQNGETVSLAELHSDGPLVLTFLRSFY